MRDPEAWLADGNSSIAVRQLNVILSKYASSR